MFSGTHIGLQMDVINGGVASAGLIRELKQALRETQLRLAMTAEIAKVGYSEFDIVSGTVCFSPEWRRLLGYDDAERPNSFCEWTRRLHPEDRGGVTAAIERFAHEPKGVLDLEYRLRHKDGGYRWFHGCMFATEETPGRVRKLFGIHVDFSERRQAELEESNARHKAVLDSLNEGVIIFDLGGQVLSANPAALAILHYACIEDTLRRLPEFVEFFDVRSVDGRERPIDEWPMARVMRGESFFNDEVMLCRKDGGSSEIISFNGAPVRSAAGERILGVLTFQNVSHRKWAEQALQESERRLCLALKASNSAVWEVDVATGRVLHVDDLLFSMLGYTPQELPTIDDWFARMHEEDRPVFMGLINDIIEGKRGSYEGAEMRYLGKDGKWHWILCQATAAECDAQGRATRLVGTHTDISERKLAEERVQKAALHDPLTGLPNRALIFEYCRHQLAAAQRSRSHGALLFIDLDRFKPINDQHGHETGDQVLKEVGRRLAACTRSEDMVGRLGGDEFVIMLAHRDSGGHRAAVVAQHVIDSISQPFRINSLELSISPSIGISFYPEHAADVSTLIHAADLAMYQAKQTGRNKYQLYTPELDHQAETAQYLENRLRHALKHGGLELHYQPVIDIRSGRLTGAEALARLPDAGGRASGPDVFIQVAEATGLIGELGEWVAAEACRQHEAWRNEGMHITIAINVSPLQFKQREFAQRLGTIIADSGIDPACLQLEVTETTVMENLDQAVDILNHIKSLGVKVALDDFGTGYSSLSRLTSLPIDKLKVDQSFVRRIESDQASRAVTQAIIVLGHTLKLDVIGEGIESRSALSYLEEHGCDQAQGFLFSEPLPAAKFAEWCRRQRVQ